jgi:hypothetical protein
MKKRRFCANRRENDVIATKIPIVIFVEKSDTPPPVELMIQQGYHHSICK